MKINCLITDNYALQPRSGLACLPSHELEKRFSTLDDAVVVVKQLGIECAVVRHIQVENPDLDIELSGVWEHHTFNDKGECICTTLSDEANPDLLLHELFFRSRAIICELDFDEAEDILNRFHDAFHAFSDFAKDLAWFHGANFRLVNGFALEPGEDSQALIKSMLLERACVDRDANAQAFLEDEIKGAVKHLESQLHIADFNVSALPESEVKTHLERELARDL